MDIWPTVLDLLGLPPIPDAEGISLVPLIQAAAEGRDPGDSAPASSVAQLDQTWGRIGADPAPMVAIRETDSRLIFRHAQPDRPEFFDLATDPTEQRNLAAEKPDEVAPLLEEARAVASRKPAEGRAIEVTVDDYNLTQLRALGYIIEKEDETASCKQDPGGPGCPPPH
jgi:arylsulfatase A-like enzyme